MSKVLHWSQKQLDEYQKRLEAQKAATPPPHAHTRTRTREIETVTPPIFTEGVKSFTERPKNRREAPGASMIPFDPSNAQNVPLRLREGQQTKTEEKYNREILKGAGRFEAVTLRLPGGGRYTPDFMTLNDGRVTFHEVKGSYRLNSQGRAFTAFHEAAAAFPMWRFVWAHWTGKKWDIKTFD